MIIFFVIFFSSVGVFASTPPPDIFLPVRKAVENQNFSVVAQLTKDWKSLKTEDQNLYWFIRGYADLKLEKYDQADTWLKKVQEKKYSLLNYYTQYFLAQVSQSRRQFKEARSAYDQVLKLRPPSHMAYQTKFQLSEMSIEQGKWSQAFTELAYLERRWRNDENYPQVLWRLIKVELKRGQKWRACAWARKLYSRFPQNPLVDDWGIDLPSAPFEGKKLDCLASLSDTQKRIRRLQWAGQSERARKELETLRNRAQGESTRYSVEFMLAQFLVNEGEVDEALKILSQYFENHQKNLAFLSLLGKAASRAGDYPMAVSAFQKAHTLSSKSRSGREALFQAAFLSYQFQDYDGATRKFEQFMNEYPHSGLSRDSRWHLSWIRYLKGDYAGALKGFDEILEQKQRRRTHQYWSKFSVEKIQYWKAMAYYRMNKLDEAKKLFEQIVKDPLWDYYRLTAQYRLDEIKNLQSLKSSGLSREVASAAPVKTPLGLLPDGDGMKLFPGDAADVSTSPTAGDENSQESESEEEMTQTQQDADGDVGGDEGDESSSEDVAGTDEEQSVPVTDFKDPELKLRFLRATALIRVGLKDWARWELFEIERRTRNQDYLKMLMNAYEQMNFYHRSSYISVVNFSQVRAKHTIDGVRSLWEFAYPLAYREYVDKYAQAFNVPREFIWGIMRTESSYRYDVVSPVGAKGLMQLMPNTAKQVARLMGDKTFNERFLGEPEVNVRLGARYLQRLLKKFDDSVPLAAASYNAGPHRVEGWLASFGNLEMDEFIEHIPFVETRNYVKKVVRDFGVYKNLYGNKNTPLNWLIQRIKIQVSQPTLRENWETL